jgi:hypothetical protein
MSGTKTNSSKNRRLKQDMYMPDMPNIQPYWTLAGQHTTTKIQEYKPSNAIKFFFLLGQTDIGCLDETNNFL